MNIRTFWWGVRLLAENDEEVAMLRHIAGAKLISDYERYGDDKIAGEFQPTADRGEPYPDDINFLDINR